MTPARSHKRWRLPSLLLVSVVLLQLITTLFFVWDTVFGILGLRTQPIAWHIHELIEIGATVGLLIGVALGATALAGAQRKNREMTEKLRAASSAFASLLEERFADWALTPAERDVAWFTVKGLAIADIARLRQTSEGTVKAQSNAIYRKAGVNGRAQLVSLFLEDLMDETAHPSGRAPAPAVAEIAEKNAGPPPEKGR